MRDREGKGSGLAAAMGQADPGHGNSLPSTIPLALGGPFWTPQDSSSDGHAQMLSPHTAHPRSTGLLLPSVPLLVLPPSHHPPATPEGAQRLQIRAS